MSKSLTERLQNTPLVIAILIFDAITSFPSFILPFLSIIYIGDLSTLVGMAVASIYLLRREKDKSNFIKIRLVILLAVIGGILVAISLSLVYYLTVTAAGYVILLSDLILFYMQWTILIALVAGCLTSGSFILSQRIMENTRQFH